MAKVHKPPDLVAVRIREARIRNGLTQKQLAEMVDVSQNTVSEWERGAKPDSRTEEKFEKMIELLEIDTTPRQETPRVEAPVPITKTLRVALSTPEDEFSYSPRKILHSLQYLQENVARLLERLERAQREIQHLEQTQGITAEQLAVLRDKARRFDEMQELMGHKVR